MAVKLVGIGGTNRANSLSYRALEIALEHAESLGAAVESYKLYDMHLPMYEPSKPLREYGDNVSILLEAVRQADGLIISTASYHGILAGITKNAMDLLDFLDEDKRPYLHGRAVGLIATGGGELGAVTALDSMIHMVHALRGVVVPVTVPIGKASKSFDANRYEMTDVSKLKRLGLMAAETLKLAGQLNPDGVEATN